MRAFSTEELQAAFQRARKPGWPATLEVALQHPLHASVIRMAATLAAVPPRHASPPPARRPPLHALPTPHATQGADRKRLAAGDRDDD